MADYRYRCKECTHEEKVSGARPLNCWICGSSDIIFIDSTVILERTMAVEKDIFSSSRFRSTIQGYCSQIGWNISDMNDSRVIIRFTMESGNTQTLFIVRYDNTLEFSCPSGVKFQSFDHIPHQLSTWLMTKNAGYKFGFWCIESISGFQVFSVMHNAEMSLIDVNYFRSVIQILTQNCDDFETNIESLI